MRVGGASREAYCIFDGWRGMDTFLVEDGVLTRRFDDPNSCPAGTNIWVPRTHSMLQRALEKYGEVAHFVGVYGAQDGCGGCWGFAMNSDEPAQTAQWTTIGPSTGAPAEPWFINSVPTNVPNSPYEAGCWLGGSLAQNGLLQLDDHDCNFAFVSYVCSSNRWDAPRPPLPPLPVFPPSPPLRPPLPLPPPLPPSLPPLPMSPPSVPSPASPQPAPPSPPLQPGVQYAADADTLRHLILSKVQEGEDCTTRVLLAGARVTSPVPNLTVRALPVKVLSVTLTERVVMMNAACLARTRT